MRILVLFISFVLPVCIAGQISFYKVYSDGFVGLDLGSSSAQSVVLLFIVGLLTIIQFKYIEKKVHY